LQELTFCKTHVTWHDKILNTSLIRSRLDFRWRAFRWNHYGYICYIHYRCILWRNRPMRELLKFRNLKERDCATVAEGCRTLPPPLLIASLRVLLGYAVTAGSRNSREGPRDFSYVRRNSTQRCVLGMSGSSVHKRD
jgi:hypothetical protein